MINYKEKGSNLHALIESSGLYLSQIDDVWVSSDDVAVQAIIDNFDPLPQAKKDALDSVKEASAITRLKFVTQAAGKDAEYTFKAQEATQFDIDGTIGVFMQGRINLTGETAAQVAAEWNYSATAWMQVGAYIAGLEDKAVRDINSETDWTQCSAIAGTIIAQLEAI